MAQPVDESYDFIVVGGGTAGNVVAGRLAENPDVKILVIEAGAGNPDEVPEIATPARAFKLRHSKYDWGYQATFFDKPDYKRVEKPNTRGKVLGGSSCLNYFTWVRGSKETFDSWSEFGGEAWTWDSCKAYFDKPATYHDDDNLYDHDFSRLGRDGPLHVSHAELVPELQPFRDALSKAWTSMGHPLGEDIYSGKMEGLVHCVNTIYKGVRSNSSVFVSTKSNVDVMPLTVCTRINFQGNTAASVTDLGQGNSETVIYAKREIIVSAGVFETPKLLLLSGIGPRKELARHAIQPVVVSENVEENLLDNPILPHSCLPVERWVWSG